MKTGIELISEERQEQVEKHNRTTEWDSYFNTDHQLSDAAAALSNHDVNEHKEIFYHNPPTNWDSALWQKMLDKPYEERLRIAGALIAAELDRLQHVRS